MDTQALIANAILNGGGTYIAENIIGGAINWSEADHEFGYYVATPHGVENLPTLALVNGSLIEDVFYARHYNSGHYFGVWQDDEQNWSVDEVAWIAEQTIAEALGRYNEQRAIWDIKNNKEVTL